MKAILVLFDSLNRRMLPPYGCDWVKAPNFERLAKKSVVFDRSYVASMPCMPARRELHTGRYNFLHRSWGPIEPFDDSMPEILKKSGVYTHLVTDHFHYWQDGGATYHNRYNTWEGFRGQEGDMWKGSVADPEIPETMPTMRTQFGGGWRQDWVNRKYMTPEEQHPQAQTFNAGLEFIKTNHDEDQWFLQIEAFDPHEPFFTPQRFKDLYPHQYDGPHYDWPDYGPVRQTDEEVQHMRYEYAALVSMCDHYLGKVLDMMDEHNLWEDTMLIVNSDHGFLLSEHDWWGKNFSPWFNETANTPLFIWDPRSGRKNTHSEALVQIVDMAPTLLDFFGVDIPSDMMGIPLRDTLENDSPVREAALFGHHGGQINITDGRYVYMRSKATEDNSPLFEYTLMPAHMHTLFTPEELQKMELATPFSFTKGCPTMKIPAKGWEFVREMMKLSPLETELYDLETDPGQLNPIKDAQVEAKMIELMQKLMKENDAPPEQYERMGLIEEN